MARPHAEQVPEPAPRRAPDLVPTPASTGPEPTPVLPDYGGGCIANLAPALLAASGRARDAGPAPAWLPAGVGGARQIVLLVLDGLGWCQLTEWADRAPTLSSAEGIDRPITSVAPSTTATALTSIGTGSPPNRHGILGYRMATPDDEVLNVLRWQLGSCAARDARRELPAAAFQSQATFPGFGGPVPVVTRDGFAQTGFTIAQIGRSRVHGYKVTSSIVPLTTEILATGAPLVYVYYDGIDKVAHERGLGTWYGEELEEVDRLVSRLAAALPGDAVLVVTADHGQVEVGTDVILPPAGVLRHTRLLTGEGRFRWFHARADAAGDLLHAARDAFGEVAWVRSRTEVVEAGWFGGRLAPELAGRLGDVAVVPHEPVAVLDPADTGETRLACRHGSLTADEMLVPLVVVGAGSGGGNI